MHHAGADKHRSTIGMLWDVLGSVLGGAEDVAAGGDPRRRSLAFLAGACKYLEAGQAKHMQHTIQANRAQVHHCCCLYPHGHKHAERSFNCGNERQQSTRH